VYSAVIMKTAHTLLPFTVLGVVLAQGPVPQPQGPQQPGRAPQQQQQPRPPQGQQQPRPPQGPDFGALKSYLNLTDAQIRQMEQARDKAAKEAEEKTKTLRPQIEEKRRALADLMDKDNADATAVGRAMLEIRGLERQLRQAHEGVRNSEISVMNAEQKAKFKAIQDAAMLPEATREAQRLGLVPGPPPQGPGPGQNPGPNPNGMRQRMPGQPMPGQPMMGPGQPQGGMPGQPMRGPIQPPPGQPRQGEPEGDR